MEIFSINSNDSDIVKYTLIGKRHNKFTFISRVAECKIDQNDEDYVLKLLYNVSDNSLKGFHLNQIKELDEFFVINFDKSNPTCTWIGLIDVDNSVHNDVVNNDENSFQVEKRFKHKVLQEIPKNFIDIFGEVPYQVDIFSKLRLV